MTFTLAHHALAIFHEHAQLHERLDRLDYRYRDLMLAIERREIRAFRDEKRFSALEELKKELMEIRFVE